jgi:hypothetical protein
VGRAAQAHSDAMRSHRDGRATIVRIARIYVPAWPWHVGCKAPRVRCACARVQQLPKRRPWSFAARWHPSALAPASSNSRLISVAQPALAISKHGRRSQEKDEGPVQQAYKRSELCHGAVVQGDGPPARRRGARSGRSGSAPLAGRRGWAARAAARRTHSCASCRACSPDLPGHERRPAGVGARAGEGRGRRAWAFGRPAPAAAATSGGAASASAAAAAAAAAKSGGSSGPARRRRRRRGGGRRAAPGRGGRARRA